MPFRIKITLIVLALLAAIVIVGPLLLPVPALTGTVAPSEAAYPDSLFVDVEVPGGRALSVHVQTAPGALTPEEAAATGGDGTGFVLLHGFGSQTMTWRHLMAELGGAGRGGEAPAGAVSRGEARDQSEHGTTAPSIAFDRPAFGLTERPAAGDWPRGANPYAPESQVGLTLALMDAYGIERGVLIGHSAGGAIALELALAHPDRVAGLVLVSPAVVRGGGPPAWSRPLLHTPQMARVGPLTMRQLGGEPGEHFLRAAYADPTRLDPVDLDAYRRAMRMHDWDRALWELSKASREPQVLARLARVDVPVLVLSGSEDTIVPPEQSSDVAARLPRATLVTLPGCGHVAHEECPEPTAEAVRSWLDRELPGF